MKRHLRWLREFFRLMRWGQLDRSADRIADLEHRVYILAHVLNEKFPQTVPWFMTLEEIDRKLQREIDELPVVFMEGTSPRVPAAPRI